MSNIAENCIERIPSADWLQLLDLAVEKENYITNIIEAETGPRRQKWAREAYARFVQAVINRTVPLWPTPGKCYNFS
jgi:hypothetical protein